MRFLTLLILLLPISAKAAFIFEYGLNYSSQAESSDAEFSQSRMFHKVFLGASVNGKRTVFFGWNINSWSSAIGQGTGAEEDTYSLQEMGPRLIWFFKDTYHWYFTAEWNPYARGTRTKESVEGDIRGTSTNFGLGYRFRLNRLWGLGAGLHYHSLSLSEQTIDSTESTTSDTINNIMPMLEISIITR